MTWWYLSDPGQLVSPSVPLLYLGHAEVTGAVVPAAVVCSRGSLRHLEAHVFPRWWFVEGLQVGVDVDGLLDALQSSILLLL